MVEREQIKKLVESNKETWNPARSLAHAIVSKVYGDSIGEMRKSAGYTTEDGLADFRGYDLRWFGLNNADFRESDLSDAILSGVSVSGLVLSQCKMQGADLTGSVFDGCNFNGVDLSGADLSDAKFPNSSMHNVDLKGAKLTRTDFARTDLTGANFDQCALTNTSLIKAKLACASIHESEQLYTRPFDEEARDVIDEYFGGSQAKFFEWLEKTLMTSDNDEAVREWKRYFGTRDSQIREFTLWPPIEISTFDSLIRIDRYLRQTIRSGFSGETIRFYYRGQDCNSWALTPSIYRAGLESVESDLIGDLIVSEPDEFRRSQSALDNLVLARHYSLPSRLLDVTRNMLVALYFACREPDPCDHGKCDRTSRLNLFVTPTELIKSADSDTVSVLAAMSFLRSVERSVLLTMRPSDGCGARTAEDGSHGTHLRPSYDDAMLRLLHFIAREKPYFQPRVDPKDLFRVLVVEPSRIFPRLRAQAGAFLLSAFHERFEAAEISEVDPSMPIYGHIRFDIPYDAKGDILRQLDAMNINRESMFPGLEASALSITARHAKPAGPGS